MVHPCDKPCGNKTASGYCATTACINPKYSNFGTAQYVQGVQKRIITNADRINHLDGILSDRYKEGFHDGLKRALQILANDVKDVEGWT